MRMFKRTLCLFLALTLCLGAGIINTAAAEEKTTEKVEDIELLNMLGIFNGYDDGELHPEKDITRMEFAALVVRSLGYAEGLGNTDTGFSDVEFESWGSGYVKAAYDLGIIAGYGDGTFLPGKNVTQAEAVKMVVSALGYGPYSERNGGYPNGYISVAGRLGILSGAVDINAKANRGYVAALLYESLETQIIQPEIENLTEDDDCILERLGITVRRGTLTAVYGASLSEGQNPDEGEVIVSGETFETKLDISKDFVGTEVKIYVKDYNDDGELLVGIVGLAKGDELTVSADNILDATTLSELVYLDANDKEIKERLSDNIKISYNGVLINNSQDYTADRLKPQNGEVKLLNSGGGSGYDTAVVKDYRTYVVRSVTDDVIYDIFGGKIEIEKDTAITITENNVIKNLSDIAAGDVLSVAMSLDLSVIEIIISRETVNGTVTEIAEDDETYYTLDSGDVLTVTEEYEVNLANGYSQAEEIKLGSAMKFYLNSFGEIAAAEVDTESKSDGEYAFIIAMEKGSSVFGNVYLMKLLTVNNRYEVFETASGGEVTFGRMEGDSYVVSKCSPEDIFNSLYFGEEHIQRQLCKYELDSNGAIKKLYLRNESGDKKYFSYDEQRGSKRVVNHLIDGKYYCDDKTRVFHIPLDAQYLTHLSSGKFDDYFSSGSYTLELYDIEADGYVNCIYYYDTGTGRALTEGGNWSYIDYVNSPVMIVTNVSVVLSDDGTEYKIVEGWENKTKVRRMLSDKLSKKTSDIKAGSIIQYATNESDKMYADTIDNDVAIVVVANLFDLTDDGADEFMLYDYTAHAFENPRIKFGYSNVARVDYPYIRLAYDDTLAEIHAGTMIYVYDRQSGEITKGDISDINEGEQIFIRSRYSNLREIIAFKN